MYPTNTSILLQALLLATISIGTLSAQDSAFNTIGLGEEPADLPLNMRAQAETHLIRSFSNPNLVFGGMQEGRFTNGGAVANGYVLSTDGGATWTRQLVPFLTRANGSGPFERASDPVAGIDFEGNLYFNSLGADFPNGVNAAPVFTQVVQRSSDAGTTFTEPLIVYEPPVPTLLADKNWMTIDTYPGSPTFGRILVAFSLFVDSGNTAQRLSTTYSDDQGVSWSTLQTLTTPNYIQGVLPMHLPDGSVVTPYWNFGSAPSWTDSIDLVVSNDGGENFGPPVTITSGLAGYRAPTIRNTASIFGGAVDRMAGVISIAYQDRISSGPNVGPRIMFTKSIDKGATWSTPTPISDNPSGSPVAVPAIAASPDGQHLTCIYYDWRDNTASGTLIDLYFSESFDGGDTWEPARRVSETSLDVTRAPYTGQRGYMLGDYQGIVPALDFDTPGYAMWIGVPSDTNSPDPLITELPRTRGTTFATWQKLRFNASQLADPAISGSAADPDFDNLSNLFEYALALEPFHPDSSPVTVDYEYASGHIIATYTKLPVLDDIEFEWLFSSDLQTWSIMTPSSITTEVNPTAAFLADVAAKFDAVGMSRAYLRLSARLTSEE
ncbi:MAG: hypothetical protein ACI8TX_003415 [Hyphomicrobiaceae bacterium]|jgi:hypothetical protein